MNNKLLCVSVVVLAGICCARQSIGSNVSFEEQPTGDFSSFETDVGIFKAQKGHAEIDNHFKSGRQALHIHGGRKRTVEFTPNLKGQKVSQMSFWAERWTNRNPFSFRIYAQTGSGWKEISNGDEFIKVGRSFLSHVRIALPSEPIKKYKFVCTSPVNSGVLIDDFFLHQPIPMQLQSLTTHHQVSPALIRKDANALPSDKSRYQGLFDSAGGYGIYDNYRPNHLARRH